MGKTIKAKKQKLFILHNLLVRSPDVKSKEDSVKLSNFFRALKKTLRDILDERAEINKTINEKIAAEQKIYAELLPKIETLDKAEKLSETNAAQLVELRFQLVENQAKADLKTKKELLALENLNKRLEKEDGESLFDNEDFLYIEGLIKANPQVFFGGKTRDGKDALDLDSMDMIFELFESAK